ncbi:MAG: MBL fold metallo-hydrolase [Vicinamibacterales bacterium]
MKRQFALSGAAALCLAAGAVTLGGQAPSAPPLTGAAQVHVEAARKAAGTAHKDIFDSTCGYLTQAPRPAAPPATGAAAAPRRPGPPARDTWFSEPARVFDNLYFVGQSEYSAWALTTSEGIILIDAIFDYSVEEEVSGGMRKLGLDPAQIKYVIVSHGHGDHSGGAKFLQDKYGARVVLSEADWDLLERSKANPNAQPVPRRDVVATDGMKLTLGDTTITLYITPGHTLGTLSTILPVKDRGRTHLAASWGGTAFNWVTGPANYITPDRPASFWFDTYQKSAVRFRNLAAQAGADVIIANHTKFDGSKTKIPALAARAQGQTHPYVIGKEGVLQYMTTVDECAQAGLAMQGAGR